ncbi:MAG: class I SAM-dependent methyltransferase [bacterium]
MMEREIALAYDRWAAQYDDNANITRDLDASVVRSVPLDVADRDVLELGCGTGKNTAWLVERARGVVALDFSPGMLAVARQRVQSPGVRFVQHDVRDPWPLDAESVDVVIGNLVLEHVQDLAPIFAEAARALRTGGQLFLCELHPFKQLIGSQARFTDPDTSETVLVTAYVHSTSEYVNTGITAGFTLESLGEWRHAVDAATAPPRLIGLSFRRAAGQPRQANISSANTPA